MGQYLSIYTIYTALYKKTRILIHNSGGREDIRSVKLVSLHSRAKTKLIMMLGGGQEYVVVWKFPIFFL